MGRAPCCDKANVKKGPWSPEEDLKLKEYIEKYGTGGNWIALPQKAGLRRCGKSCRLRWLNYLRPNLKHGEFSDDEDRIICNLFATIGSRWSIIAAQLPGRTDNDIKNYWNTKLKKKLIMGMVQVLPHHHHHQHQPPLSSHHQRKLPQFLNINTSSTTPTYNNYYNTTQFAKSFTSLESSPPPPPPLPISIQSSLFPTNLETQESLLVGSMRQQQHSTLLMFGSSNDHNNNNQQASCCTSSDGSSNNNNNNNQISHGREIGVDYDHQQQMGFHHHHQQQQQQQSYSNFYNNIGVDDQENHQQKFLISNNNGGIGIGIGVGGDGMMINGGWSNEDDEIKPNVLLWDTEKSSSMMDQYAGLEEIKQLISSTNNCNNNFLVDEKKNDERVAMYY